MAMLFVSSLLVLTFAFSGQFTHMDDHDMSMHRFPPTAFFCLFPLAVIGGSWLIGTWSFRRVATPVAEVMNAADAVANGDLQVKLKENQRGPFRGLQKSFNRMTEALAHAEQQRRNLTADVAHELRTPLHIIQGNLEGVLDGVYEPTPEHIQATLDETRLLARLVSDLQTLSLAEAGQLPLYPTQVSVTDLLQDAQVRFSGQAQLAEIQLLLDLPPIAENWLLDVDVDRIEQVLNNLLANALRHTPAGGRVTLSAELQSERIALQVQDTGTGIAPEELPYVFDRFWKSDPARKRQVGSNSGLGLAIARQLVQAQGGEIQVASAPGQGACFTIVLPLASDSAEQK